MLKLEYKPYTLDFTFDAGTSRGVLKKRKVWFVKIVNTTNLGIYGIGEAAPLEWLSSENIEDIETQLEHIAGVLSKEPNPVDFVATLKLAEKLAVGFPSIRMALEMALLDLLNNGSRIWFESDFTKGEKSIPINGLIWMGDKKKMKAQIDQKFEEGYQCIKLKIGAINFKDELSILEYLRSKSDELVIRVDANGAFKNKDAFKKIDQLSVFNLHSIEQPILPRQPEVMQLLCSKSKIPIALDEDLIGFSEDSQKKELLDEMAPQYLVLKPSLLGGFVETKKWIELAEERNIGWWITSALESNLGLNAISQFAAQYPDLSYQGLGTGQLYNNNFKSKAVIGNKEMVYDDSIIPENPFDL